ncbi:hypothetical protein BB561_001544 [Smittium simulii]|uniref:Uncharacterized protein n=1 Tax=Smittium simulii TaxID=133385 RepID=A0A2T9YU39_9FUNG|nr:hypothetical protein BB561_001544 [Smittium simulii]
MSLQLSGIRREDKNIWERRAPLTPKYVSKIIGKTNTKVYVQPSNNRIFPDHAYEKAGAIISEDLSNADIILAIKETPISKLIPNKTYCMFSHTHKAQEYNKNLLSSFLEKNIRVLDYELIRNPKSLSRLVFFGKFAGYAGMIDGIHGLGQKMLAMGYNTPLINVAMSHTYPTLNSAKLHLREVGKNIKANGFPKEFGPVVFTITGSGNVSQGVQEIFECLPHEYIDSSELHNLVQNFNGEFSKLNKIYGVKVTAKDYIENKDNGVFDYSEYKQYPSKYMSSFHKKIAPYTTMLANGLYWDTKFPKILTKQHLKLLQADPNNKFRMLSISDISCDISGSIESTYKSSSISTPFFYYDAENDIYHENIIDRGVQMMTIDNLPTELPLESSENFSESLYPIALKMIKNDFNDPVVQKSIITENGKLKDEHKHLYSFLNQNNTYSDKISVKSNEKKKVFLAGSGLVTKPLVNFLLNQKNIQVSIASNNISEANALASSFEEVNVLDFDICNRDSVDKMVMDHDIVVSMLPASLHPKLALSAIKNKKNMVTASYISPDMQKLDQSAKDAGITILSELGLDPGIDHCSAMKIIDDIKSRGGKVTSFISWCGGLPAPENSKNPLGYKFSWSPQGVLIAGLNSAKFKLGGKIIEIEGSKLLENKFETVPLYNGFNFEGLANRDSLSYADAYGLDANNIHNMLRGTLRYKGYSELMSCFVKLGFLDNTPYGKNLNSIPFNNRTEFCKYVLNINSGDFETAKKRISEILNIGTNSDTVLNVVRALQSFGMIENCESTNCKESNTHTSTNLGVFCNILQQNLNYRLFEKDMVALYHEFIAEFSPGVYEIHTSSLITYGTNLSNGIINDTAMSKTVGIPAAIGAKILLSDQVKIKGVIRPTHKEIYEPVLKTLTTLGAEDLIRFEESSKKVNLEQLKSSSLAYNLKY